MTDHDTEMNFRQNTVINMGLVLVFYLLVIVPAIAALGFPWGHSKRYIAADAFFGLMILGPIILIGAKIFDKKARLIRYAPAISWVFLFIALGVSLAKPYVLGLTPFTLTKTTVEYITNPFLMVTPGVLFLMVCLQLVYPLRKGFVTGFVLSLIPVVLSIALLAFLVSTAPVYNG